MKTLRETLEEINRWQDQVFTKATPESAATHLRREAQELYENPHDPEEVADIFILLAAVSHLAGIDLVEAVEAKMKINRERTWGEPDSEGVVEHVREEWQGPGHVQHWNGEGPHPSEENYYIQSHSVNALNAKDEVIGQQVKGKTLLEVFEKDELLYAGESEIGGTRIILLVKQPENFPEELKELTGEQRDMLKEILSES